MPEIPSSGLATCTSVETQVAVSAGVTRRLIAGSGVPGASGPGWVQSASPGATVQVQPSPDASTSVVLLNVDRTLTGSVVVAVPTLVAVTVMSPGSPA